MHRFDCKQLMDMLGRYSQLRIKKMSSVRDTQSFENNWVFAFTVWVKYADTQLICCSVIVLDIPFKHAPWPSTLDLYFAVHWLWICLRRSLVFSTSVIAASLKPCIVIVLDIPFKHAPWPWPIFHGLLTLKFFTSKFCFLDISDSCKCETLHSNCPWHTLQARTLTRWPWPIFHSPLTLLIFRWKFGFLCISNSCKLETLHSNCPWHTLQARTLTRWPWPIFNVFTYFAGCRWDIDLCGVLVLCRLFIFHSCAKQCSCNQWNQQPLPRSYRHSLGTPRKWWITNIALLSWIQTGKIWAA